MKPEDVYEVFVLLDHASDFEDDDESISGTAALGIAAGLALASDLAYGVPEVAVEVPPSARACAERAVEQVQRWSKTGLGPRELRLASVMIDLGRELGVVERV